MKPRRILYGIHYDFSGVGWKRSLHLHTCWTHVHFEGLYVTTWLAGAATCRVHGSRFEWSYGAGTCMSNILVVVAFGWRTFPAIFACLGLCVLIDSRWVASGSMRQSVSFFGGGSSFCLPGKVFASALRRDFSPHSAQALFLKFLFGGDDLVFTPVLASAVGRDEAAQVWCLSYFGTPITILSLSVRHGASWKTHGIDIFEPHVAWAQKCFPVYMYCRGAWAVFFQHWVKQLQRILSPAVILLTHGLQSGTRKNVFALY